MRKFNKGNFLGLISWIVFIVVFILIFIGLGYLVNYSGIMNSIIEENFPLKIFLGGFIGITILLIIVMLGLVIMIIGVAMYKLYDHIFPKVV